jgi:hypothetical protein
MSPSGRTVWRSIPSGDPEYHWQQSGAVDKSIVLGFKSRYLHAEIPNRYVADYVSKYPAKLIGFAGIDPTEKGAAGEVRFAKEDLRLRGITISPANQDFHPTDSRAMKVYEAAEQHGMPIIVHPSGRFTEQSKLEYGRPYLLDEVARTFPKLRLVIAQMGQPWIDETICMLGKHDQRLRRRQRPARAVRGTHTTRWSAPISTASSTSSCSAATSRTPAPPSASRRSTASTSCPGYEPARRAARGAAGDRRSGTRWVCWVSPSYRRFLLLYLTSDSAPATIGRMPLTGGDIAARGTNGTLETSRPAPSERAGRSPTSRPATAIGSTAPSPVAFAAVDRTADRQMLAETFLASREVVEPADIVLHFQPVLTRRRCEARGDEAGRGVACGRVGNGDGRTR